MLHTPILFLVFNRPDTTRQVFAKIREIQPKQLFIAADGAREGKEGEKEKTEQVRKLILEGIDWECEVRTLFRDKNLGCGKAVSQAITWFFENVEQGIILEDDTLPDLSFFPFCEELLERYKDDEKITMISGYCSFGKMKDKYSYSFTEGAAGIWGWATWRRTWNLYDFEINDFGVNRDKLLAKGKSSLVNNLELILRNQLDTWDYQLSYLLEKKEGFSIRSNKNLIKNVGFSETGTHTTSWEMEVYYPNSYPLSFPLKHPTFIQTNNQYIINAKKAAQKQEKGEYSRLKMLKLKMKRHLKIS